MYIDELDIQVLWGAGENSDDDVNWWTAPIVDDNTASKFAKLAKTSPAETQYQLHEPIIL